MVDASDYVVSVVRSDDEQLHSPVQRDIEPTTRQVEAMVRRAVALAGGLKTVIADTARLVLLKPNIVRSSGQGTITDPRVVRAVARLVYEHVPQARIIVGEGSGGWVSPDLIGTVPVSLPMDWIGSPRVDGFETSGYRAMVDDLRSQGINIRLRDLNFDPAIERTVPGGELAVERYGIAGTVFEADAWINIPVAKTHGSKITGALKNPFGILPGHYYGWSKSRGTKVHTGLQHAPRIIDEIFVDLALVAPPDFVVMDMLAGSEAGAFNNEYKRSNLVLAGHNPVAVDLVAGKLMGFNPDDFEFAELAARRDAGPRWYDDIDLRGADVGPLVTRWVKAGGDYWGEWSEHANYGKGPRRLTFYGPVDREHTFNEQELAQLTVTPGADGWSAPVWFGHDRIDLDTHFDDPTHVSVYAHSRFTMPKDDDVRFWLGADDHMQVWIDGALIYESKRGRRLGRRGRDQLLGQVKMQGHLTAGEHDLLIRVEQRRGGFEFSFNICEPIDDPRFAGNTYPGLRYHLREAAVEADVVVAAQPGWSDDLIETETVSLGYDPTEAGAWPESLVVDIAPTNAGLLHAANAVLDLGRSSALIAGLQDLPFTMVPVTLDGLVDTGLDLTAAPGLDEATKAQWIGFDYHMTHGLNPVETQPVFRNMMTRGEKVLRSSNDGWVSLGGYRRVEGDLQVRLMIPGEEPIWEGTDWWWWTDFNGKTLWRPIAVLRPAAEQVPGEALVDSLVTLAVDLARMPNAWLDDPNRGETAMPVGLAAWDETVRAWEALPLTRDWAMQSRQRQLLARMRLRHVLVLADARQRAATLLEWSADRAWTTRGDALRQSAAAYRRVADRLRDLADRLPAHPWGLLTAEDASRLARLEQARPLWRLARNAEREALQALVDGFTLPSLPPQQDQGTGERRKLLTLTGPADAGVHYVAIRDGRDMVRRTDEGEVALSSTLHAAVPQGEKWRIELERVRGGGAYRVVAQPTADNGWHAEIRVEESYASWSPDGVELVLWAVQQ